MLPYHEQRRMRTLVAQLLYISIRVRPDILLVVNFLTTKVNKFSEKDKKNVNRELKDLFGTRHLGLILRITNNTPDITITTFADASYGVHTNGRSQSGACTTLGIGSIQSLSNKQKLTTKSSCEAELVAASDAASQSLGIRNYLISRQRTVNPIILGQDNLSTKSILEKGPRVARRIKHLTVRHFFIHDHVQDGQMEVKYINTNDMIADILTKSLQGEHFIRLRGQLLGSINESM